MLHVEKESEFDPATGDPAPTDRGTRTHLACRWPSGATLTPTGWPTDQGQGSLPSLRATGWPTGPADQRTTTRAADQTGAAESDRQAIMHADGPGSMYAADGLMVDKMGPRSEGLARSCHHASQPPCSKFEKW
jgi:hypothetical protein